ncbi:MAG: hypothetical protein NE334_09230 [Lentisphaeraceae bacterium]|nr:hypothetical protein [Lentisphaeraceae bacterium]
MLGNFKKLISKKKNQVKVKKCSEADMAKALKMAVDKAETQANIRLNLDGI